MGLRRKTKKLFKMKSYLRFLSRNKLHTAIEVVGLSVSLAFVIIIGCHAWNMYTLTWNIPDHDKIYALNGTSAGMASMELYNHINKIPEVQEHVIYNYNDIYVEGSEGMFADKIILAGEGFFEMFPRIIKAGNIGRLKDDGTVVITTSMADRLFGGPEEAIGQPITLNKFGSREDPSYYNTLQISAVIENFDNSIFMSAGLVINHEAGVRCTAPSYSPQLFVKTDGFISRKELSDKVRQIIDEHCTEDPHWNPEYMYADPLDDIIMHESHYGMMHSGTILMIILSAIAIVLLLSAVFNYINLTFAQTAKRSNEIATMRLVGAQKGEILRQHLMESLVMTTICTIIALLLIITVTPMVNGIITGMIQGPTEIPSIGLTWRSIPVIVVIAMVTGLVSGIVPAGLAISFSPIEVTKGSFRKMRKMIFSRIFIGINTVIAVILMVFSITLEMTDMKFRNTPTSWNSENILFMSRSTYGNMRDDAIFVERLKALPFVKTIGMCDGGIARNHVMTQKDLQGNGLMMSVCTVDTTTFRMMGLDQTHAFNVPLEGSVWYSESLVERLGANLDELMAADPSAIVPGFRDCHSGGVVKDFVCCDPSRFYEIPYQILKVESHPYGYFYAIETTGPHDEARAAIEEELKKYCNETTGYYESREYFGYAEDFIKESLAGMRIMVIIATAFLVIALVISILGLFAMSSYFAEENTKGIAIHKVFGGTVKSETVRNIRKYMRIIVIANTIGLPLGSIITRLMLQGLPRVNMLWPILLSCIASVTLSLASVLWQTLRAARTNPAEALKKE